MTTRTLAQCGLRAISSDGVSIIDGTSIPNLFVNTGHGHLGWTLAANNLSRAFHPRP